MSGKKHPARFFLRSGTALGGPGMLALGVTLLAAGAAQANPQGGTVSGGAATILGQGTSSVQVTQHSNRAVIDWRSFNIAPNETAVFHQPSATSAVLNRIHDHKPSEIMGSLSGNGIVALVNPNGMVFGRGSQVDVGSLIATTSDIPGERFLSGENLLFGQPGETDAAIVNRGHISVKEGGLAALVAPHVRNEGVIAAKAGRVAMGAGEVFTVDLYGDGLVSLAATGRLDEAAVEQAGGIKAEGGTVLLTTAEAKGVMDRAVNMDGWVDVSGLATEAGSIVLHAAEGTASVTGKLHADGAVGTGGKLQVTGEHVKVGAGAILTAIGTYGGGDIKIGGDYLGGGTTPRAKTTKIESGATINAGATASGKGGRVIAWSDERTDFGGLIRAKGGLLSGDGGFVETSSKEILSVYGLVDASAPKGKGGEWLLDPNNVTINTTADANVAGAPNYTTTNDSAVVTVASIEGALNAGTSVSITTGTAGANTQTGNITVSNAISKTAGGNASLTLKAYGNIDVNAGISSNAGELNLTLWSDSDSAGGGYIRVTSAAITTNDGDVVIGGGADPAANPAVGNATVDDGVTLNNGDISTGAGSIFIRGRGEAAGANNYGVYIHTGSALQSTSGDITISGTGGNGTTDNYGVRLDGNGTLAASTDGTIDITGVGGNGSGSDNYGIYLHNSADITSIGTGAGAATITLDGTGGDGTSNNFGIQLGAASLTSVDGDISLTGQGGDGSAQGNIGLWIRLGAEIASIGTGLNAAAVTFNGTGGAGTDSNHGIRIENVGTVVASVDGDIDMTGVGGGDGTDINNRGIFIHNGANIVSTGTGAGAATVTLDGTGGAGTQGNVGIYFQDVNPLITSVDGDIFLTGRGGNGSSINNYGLMLRNSVVASTGTGADAATITLDGNGGNGTTSNYGVYLWLGAQVTTDEGDVFITGIGSPTASGTNNDGIRLDDSDIISTGGAGITLSGTAGANASSEDIQTSGGAEVIGGGAATGDMALNFNSYSLANLSVETTGDITLQPRTAGTTVGVAGGAGALNLSGAVLDIMDWGDTLILGRTDGSAAMTVNARDWGARNVHLRTGSGQIILNGAQTNLDDFTLTTDADPNLASTADGTGTLTLQTSAAPTTLGFAGGAGTVNYSGADLAQLGTNWTAYQIGSTAATGAVTVNAHAWDDPVTFRSAAGSNIAVAGAQTAVAASDATFTFAGPATLNANLDTTAATGGTRAIALNGAVTLAADAQVLAGSGPISFASTVDGAFDLTVSSAGAITLGGNVGAVTPLDDLTLTSDADPSIGGTVEGTGILTLQQASNATTMGIAGGAGALNYSAADLAGLGSDWASVRLGSPTATGTLTAGAHAWGNPVTFRAAAAGDIAVTGAQTAVAASDTTFTFSGPATLSADLDTSAATGGTQAIALNGAVTLAGDTQVLSGAGPISFASTVDGAFDLTLNGAGVLTLSGDVGVLTPLDGLTLTTDADPVIGGAVEGTGILTLQQSGNATTMGLAGAVGTVSFSNAELVNLGAGWAEWRVGSATGTGTVSVGAHSWADPVTFRSAAGGNTAITGNQQITAASDGSLAFTGPVSLSADIDTSNGAGAARNLTFPAAVTLAGDSHLNAGTGDIQFDGAVDGAFGLELTTTNDITFADDAGGVARLGDVLVDPRHFTAGVFNAASFTLTGGTGDVTFTGAGLNTTGDIGIDTDGNVTGTYEGVNGALEAGTGAITATVSFAALDIGGAAATLTAGYIGAPGAADQTMANLIAIDGQRDPWPAGIPNAGYTFAGFQIGTGDSSGGGGGGGNDTPTAPPPSPPAPPPAPEPSVTPPQPPVSETPPSAPNADPVRVQRSAQAMTQADGGGGPFHGKPRFTHVTYSEALLKLLGCDGDRRHASCSLYEP